MQFTCSHLVYLNKVVLQLWPTAQCSLYSFLSSISALIPLSEFSHPSTAKKYGVKPDAETLDMLNTIAKQKEVAVVSKVLFGDPREKLCQAIHDMPISSLVIGSRGLGKLKRVLLGSVSDYVVNNAACPVTVVKPASNHA